MAETRPPETASAASDDRPTVPAPEPPDSPDAWYAPDVREQREVHPGVVVTVRETGADEDPQFRYELREPPLSAADRETLERVREHFADAHPARPRTRAGVLERAAAGFDGKYARVLAEQLAAAWDDPAASESQHREALLRFDQLATRPPRVSDDCQKHTVYDLRRPSRNYEYVSWTTIDPVASRTVTVSPPLFQIALSEPQ